MIVISVEPHATIISKCLMDMVTFPCAKVPKTIRPRKERKK